jgi:hypothetical protein
MRISKSLKAVGSAFAVVAMLGLAGCGEEGAGEKAGKKLDNAAKEAGKTMDDMKKSLSK